MTPPLLRGQHESHGRVVGFKALEHDACVAVAEGGETLVVLELERLFEEKHFGPALRDVDRFTFRRLWAVVFDYVLEVVPTRDFDFGVWVIPGATKGTRCWFGYIGHHRWCLGISGIANGVWVYRPSPMLLGYIGHRPVACPAHVSRHGCTRFKKNDSTRESFPIVCGTCSNKCPVATCWHTRVLNRFLTLATTRRLLDLAEWLGDCQVSTPRSRRRRSPI